MTKPSTLYRLIIAWAMLQTVTGNPPPTEWQIITPDGIQRFFRAMITEESELDLLPAAESE